MASALSYEMFEAQKGAANGIATLDSSGLVPVSQLPPQAIETYKGEYADEAAIIAAYPSADLADYAWNVDTDSYWYWNQALGTPAWVNQQITEAAYNALSANEQNAVPYMVNP